MQIKIDTETFGDFVRHRGGRRGRGPMRGDRSQGGYYGRQAVWLNKKDDNAVYSEEDTEE